MKIMKEQAPDVTLMAPLRGPRSSMQNMQGDQQKVWEKHKRLTTKCARPVEAQDEFHHGKSSVIQQQLFADPSVTWKTFISALLG